MSVNCRIDIDLPADGIVNSGRDVTGTVTLTVDKATTVKGVTVEVKGKGKCQWSERKSESVVIWYTGNEKFVSDVKDLIKPEEGEKTTLEAGVQTFPFSFHIPAGVPSSRELPHANIRYRIQTKVLRPWKTNMKFDAYFTVFTHLDLNIEAFASDPVLAEQTKKFYNLVVKGGDMRVEVRSPVGGYMPGQVVPLACKISNESRVGIRHVEAALFKVPTQCVGLKDQDNIKYTANGGHSKKVSQRQDNVVYDKLVPEKDGTMTADLKLTVPTHLSTSLYNTKIISVIYVVKVKIKVSGLHKSPVVSFPLVIGSLPLYDLPGPSTGYIPVVSEPPPSYEESEGRRDSFSSTEDLSERMKTMLDDDMCKPPIE